MFRFHMPTEPSSIDPALLVSSDASYFLINVMRGLYTYHESEGLKPEGAQSCAFETPRRISCRLKKDRKWSDGTDVVADDYVRAFRRLVTPTARSLSVELLKRVKNAVEIHAGKMAADQLGVRAQGSHRLIFDFESRDQDFLYKLTHSVLVPVKSEKFPKREDSAQTVVNGPYKVASWTPGRRIRLEPNSRYEGFEARPPVEILMIDDDQTALNLYDQGELTFLRRLPATYIGRYKTKPDFIQIPVARFDYIGFGEELRHLPDLRAALSMSVDYGEIAKILEGSQRGGCPGISEKLLNPLTCLEFNPQLAREKFAKLSEETRTKRFRMTFSKLGGDDIKKTAEWFQAQWKKNLGFHVELEQVEQGVHIHTLKTKPPPIFRKGMHLERPTCLAALETFAAGGPENFLKIEDPRLEAIIKDLANTTSAEAKRKLCSQGVARLIDENRLIPLGRASFTLLVNPQFTGWSLNEMNQLNLAGLKTRVPSEKKKP